MKLLLKRDTSLIDRLKRDTMMKYKKERLAEQRVRCTSKRLLGRGTAVTN